MKKAILYLDRIIQILTNIASWMAGTLIFITVFIVCYEVLMRGMFNSPTEWSIEVSVYLVLISGFLGMAAALADDKHIKVDLLISRLPARVNLILGVVVSLAGLFFCFVLFYEGWEMVMSSFRLGRTSTSTLRVPMYIPQLAVPLGALLITLQFARKMAKDAYTLWGAKDS